MRASALGCTSITSLQPLLDWRRLQRKTDSGVGSASLRSKNCTTSNCNCLNPHPNQSAGSAGGHQLIRRKPVNSLAASRRRLSLKDLERLVKDGSIEVERFCIRCKKITYQSEAEARKYGAEMRRRGRGHTVPYRCPRNSDNWHLTSMKQHPKR